MDRGHGDLFDHYYYKCLVLFRKEISELKGREDDGPIWFVGVLLCGISVKSIATCASTQLLTPLGKSTTAVDRPPQRHDCIPAI
jgi:hypothetical protein